MLRKCVFVNFFPYPKLDQRYNVFAILKLLMLELSQTTIISNLPISFYDISTGEAFLDFLELDAFLRFVWSF